MGDLDPSFPGWVNWDFERIISLALASLDARERHLAASTLVEISTFYDLQRGSIRRNPRWLDFFSRSLVFSGSFQRVL